MVSELGVLLGEWYQFVLKLIVLVDEQSSVLSPSWGSSWGGMVRIRHQVDHGCGLAVISVVGELGILFGEWY